MGEDRHWHRPTLKLYGERMVQKASKKQPEAGGSPLPTEEIKFYRANEKPYGAFSNLYKSPIEFEGKTYPTAEHAYQAGKAAKPAVRDWILSAPTPALAAMAAHGLYVWDVVPDWASIKFARMRKVLRAKFSQHETLAKLLIETGDRRLVEAGTVNNAVNRLWGEVSGSGQNMLGVMLMELRKDLISGTVFKETTERKRKASEKPLPKQKAKTKKSAARRSRAGPLKVKAKRR
ncbi:NADAR family protein [Bradyrhizobium sp. AZCC 2289]|uniref:NADAR family protein n=1 Tax=Bradyrhizobium sp. AZCC 2289 TaxID=3117026 RepID=UPI002FF34221